MSKPASISVSAWRMSTLGYLVLILLCAVGCSDSLPPVANPERGREALQTALDAWQKGEKVESLQASQPAIHVNDPDWRDNKKLLKFEIGSGEFHGQSWRCEVLLTFQDGAGKATPHQVKYLIDTDPAMVVVRD